jgi:hypothetical protein
MYDDQGNHSRARIGVTLENGWVAKVFQKIGKIDFDADRSGTEEAYLEKPGSFRIGKVYVPFGTNDIIRESGFGGVVQTELDFLGLPIEIGYVYNGRRRQVGAAGRIGATAGVSFAIGDHWAINGASLTQLREPEDSPGPGRGYRLLLGADATLRIGGLQVTGEIVLLRNPNSVVDEEEDVVNFRVAYQFPFGPLVEGEATFALRDQATNLRAAAEIAVMPKVFFVPSVRLYDDGGWAFNAGMRIRL